MNEYTISLSYKIGEKMKFKAGSLEEAKQEAVSFAEERLVCGSSEVSYEVLGPNDEYAEGEIHG